MTSSSWQWWCWGYAVLVLPVAVAVLWVTPYRLQLGASDLSARCVGVSWNASFDEITRVSKFPNADGTRNSLLYTIVTRDSGRRFVIGPIWNTEGRLVDLKALLGY